MLLEKAPRLSHDQSFGGYIKFSQIQVPRKIYSMCFKHRSSEVAARIHEEATWFCSWVGSVSFYFLLPTSKISLFFFYYHLFFFRIFFWKGRCSYVLNLRWVEVKKENVIVALLQQTLKDVQYLPLGLR